MSKVLLSKASRKIAILAFGVLLYAGATPSYAATTTADFLKWDRQQQDSFFQISMIMAVTIASQIKPSLAGCIDDWYFENKELQRQRHAEILDQMPQLKEFEPSAVVLGFIEAACGEFGKK